MRGLGVVLVETRVGDDAVGPRFFLLGQGAHRRPRQPVEAIVRLLPGILQKQCQALWHALHQFANLVDRQTAQPHARRQPLY